MSLVKGEGGCGLDKHGIRSGLSLCVCKLDTLVNLTVKMMRERAENAVNTH